MTITTKFNGGDLVYYLKGDKIESSNLISLSDIQWYITRNDLTWNVKKEEKPFWGVDYITKKESELFKTKEELLQSL